MLYGPDDKDTPTTKQVDMLKICNDILVAGIYGITKPKLEHMLKSFKVLAKKPEYVQTLLEAMGDKWHQKYPKVHRRIMKFFSKGEES